MADERAEPDTRELRDLAQALVNQYGAMPYSDDIERWLEHTGYRVTDAAVREVEEHARWLTS